MTFPLKLFQMYIIKNKILIVLCFVLICACTTQIGVPYEQDISRFSSKDKCINLVLNKNRKTYELTRIFFKGYGLKGSCQGNWTIRNDSILLYCKDHFSSRLCSGSICKDSIIFIQKSNSILYYPELDAFIKIY